ncbi:MAG: hypothetical protein RSA79_04315 [Oscillospiraceae bacterium]
MKKTLSLIVSICLLCSIFVGCTKKDVAQNSSETKTSSSTNSSAPKTSTASVKQPQNSQKTSDKTDVKKPNSDEKWKQVDKDNELLFNIGFGFGWSRALATGYGNKIYTSDITPEMKKQYAAIEQMYKDGKHLRDVVIFMGYKDPGAELSDILVNDIKTWGKLPV